MRDAFINAVNAQKTALQWMNISSDNLINVYTPGFRANVVGFKSYLDNAILDSVIKSDEQGKAIPGTSPENVYIEGKGYFVIRNSEGKLAYTRFGDFKFDGDGIYRASDGSKVQGYILNDNGEVMAGTKSLNSGAFKELIEKSGAKAIPTTEIRLWKDQQNGKYLGKYEEFEIKEDGILYGKADDGKVMTPLYKLAFLNFNNPSQLFEFKQGQFLETEYSGRPVLGQGEIRSGLYEGSNVNLQVATKEWKKSMQMNGYTGKIIGQCSTLTESCMGLLSD